MRYIFIVFMLWGGMCWAESKPQNMSDYDWGYAQGYESGLGDSRRKWELKHIIHDNNTGPENLEETNCLPNEEHLFIDLPLSEYEKIIGKTNIKTSFNAEFCIKCRLIKVNCCGNDTYRYQKINAR